jgi:hypothetical protein
LFTHRRTGDGLMPNYLPVDVIAHGTRAALAGVQFARRSRLC